MVKVAAGMIIFNGNYVLEECLESMYPHVDQILIAEGPVQFWQEQGYTTSDDGTNDVIHQFYDPENKITIVHGQYQEKTEQANAYMKYLRDDIDYIFNIDSDEFYKDEDWGRIKNILNTKKYSEIQFRSHTFFGGFEYLMGGYEATVKYVRIQKVYPGAKWKTHRPPRIEPKRWVNYPPCVLTHEDTDDINIRMYHYSYVFPKQVKQKATYYELVIDSSNCIENYYENVWKPWVLGDEREKQKIENKYNGVHKYKKRSMAFTNKFTGEHPKIIQDRLPKLKEIFNQQLLTV